MRQIDGLECYSTREYALTYTSGFFAPLPDMEEWDEPNFQLKHNPGRLISVTREHSDTILQFMQGPQNIFWTTRANPEEDEFLLHPRVLDILQLMGFYGPARSGYIKLDRHLITALVERWRLETHTFHFPIGEVTITLQDVAIICGLPIEGEHVWQGFRPQATEMRSTITILLSALSDRLQHMAEIDEHTPQ
ncbi:hypothetical protein ACS0TY_030503 [Phlomoides rotata]